MAKTLQEMVDLTPEQLKAWRPVINLFQSHNPDALLLTRIHFKITRMFNYDSRGIE